MAVPMVPVTENGPSQLYHSPTPRPWQRRSRDRERPRWERYLLSTATTTHYPYTVTPPFVHDLPRGAVGRAVDAGKPAVCGVCMAAREKLAPFHYCIYDRVLAEGFRLSVGPIERPPKMYPMLERISPRTRKLELFARMHNTHAGWLSLGNQLNGVRLVDEGLRARFKAAYPDVEVQPPSPPRVSSAADVDSGATQVRSPFVSMDLKQPSRQFMDPAQPEAYTSERKQTASDV